MNGARRTHTQLPPFLRKLGLTAHIIASVGWLGAAAAFLAIAMLSKRPGECILHHILRVLQVVQYAVGDRGNDPAGPACSVQSRAVRIRIAVPHGSHVTISSCPRVTG
jgi:hypothetical protein